MLQIIGKSSFISLLNSDRLSVYLTVSLDFSSSLQNVGVLGCCNSNSQKEVEMDTFYISHGSPTLSIDDSIPARHFLKAWQEKGYCQRPKAILVISGHWDTAVPSVNVITGLNETIHDFYGFPKDMYKVFYTILYYTSIHNNIFLFFSQILGFFSFPKRKILIHTTTDFFFLPLYLYKMILLYEVYNN